MIMSSAEGVREGEVLVLERHEPILVHFPMKEGSQDLHDTDEQER